jgi:Type IV secretion-system coupling protein DNA-binding domain
MNESLPNFKGSLFGFLVLYSFIDFMALAMQNKPESYFYHFLPLVGLSAITAWIRRLLAAAKLREKDEASEIWHFAETVRFQQGHELHAPGEMKASAYTFAFDFYLDEVEVKSQAFRHWLRKNMTAVLQGYALNTDPRYFDTRFKDKLRDQIKDSLLSCTAFPGPPFPPNSKYRKHQNTPEWYESDGHTSRDFLLPKFVITSVEESFWYYKPEELKEEIRLFSMPLRERMRHIYLAGKTQYGKSTLIQNLVLSDIRKHRGICVLDPHGDLADALLASVPEDRANDCIYLDATAPVPIDFMGWETEKEKDMLADDLLVVFRRFSEGWGERMDPILRYTIYTLLSVKGSTFLDIYYFLVDEGKRRAILESCANPDLKRYWKEEFPKHSKDAVLPITSRMSKFLLTPSLKAMLGSPHPTLDFYDCMQENKIVLVNLSKIGQESGNLLGSLIVSKIQQSAMRREHGDREPFFLFVDEFQRFQTSAFDVILSEAGKYGLSLTLAHQYLSQIDAKMLSSILGNVSTFCLFRLDKKDANQFDGQLLPEHLEQIPTLTRGYAIYKLVSGPSEIMKTPPPLPYSHANYARQIRANTMTTYGTHAESSTKRIVDNPPSNNSEMPHSEGNVSDDHSEAATLPTDQPKKGNSRGAGKA